MSFQKPIQKFGMNVDEAIDILTLSAKLFFSLSKITISMNASRLLNLAAIFSLDLESQFNRDAQRTVFRIKASNCISLYLHLMFYVKYWSSQRWRRLSCSSLLGNCLLSGLSGGNLGSTSSMGRNWPEVWSLHSGVFLHCVTEISCLLLRKL